MPSLAPPTSFQATTMARALRPSCLSVSESAPALARQHVARDVAFGPIPSTPTVLGSLEDEARSGAGGGESRGCVSLVAAHGWNAVKTKGGRR